MERDFGVTCMLHNKLQCFRCSIVVPITNLVDRQVVATPDKKKVTAEGISLVETGPRMTLNPIKIISGGFGGSVLYSNPTYVSPNLASQI